MTEPDIHWDMLVRSPRGLYCAVEVQGPGHGKRISVKDGLDDKKRAFAASMHLPVAELWLHTISKKPVEKQWCEQIAAMRAYFQL